MKVLLTPSSSRALLSDKSKNPLSPASKRYSSAVSKVRALKMSTLMDSRDLQRTNARRAKNPNLRKEKADERNRKTIKMTKIRSKSQTVSTSIALPMSIESKSQMWFSSREHS